MRNLAEPVQETQKTADIHTLYEENKMIDKERFPFLTEPFVFVPENIAILMDIPEIEWIFGCKYRGQKVDFDCADYSCDVCVCGCRNPNRDADITRIKEVLEREKTADILPEKSDIGWDPINGVWNLKVGGKEYPNFLQYFYDPTKGTEQFVEGMPKIIMQEMEVSDTDKGYFNDFVLCYNGYNDDYPFVTANDVYKYARPIQPKEEPKEEPKNSRRLTRPEILKILPHNDGVWRLEDKPEEIRIDMPSKAESQDNLFRICINWQDDPAVDKFLEPTEENFKEYLK